MITDSHGRVLLTAIYRPQGVWLFKENHCVDFVWCLNFNNNCRSSWQHLTMNEVIFCFPIHRPSRFCLQLWLVDMGKSAIKKRSQKRPVQYPVINRHSLSPIILFALSPTVHPLAHERGR